MNCLNEIIGLSRTQCNCITNGAPLNYNVSRSGIYLDEVENFNIQIAKGAEGCVPGGIWDILNISVQNAKQSLIADLLAAVNANYKLRANTYTGVIGDVTYKNTLFLNENYAGVRLVPFQLKGAFISIKKIGVIVNQNVNITVSIYSNENGSTLIDSFTTVTPVNANVITWINPPANIKLPMWSNNCNVEYTFVMHLNNSFQVKDNKKDCGCSYVKRDYLNWFDFHGVKGNNLNDMSTFSSSANIINGMNLDVEISCNTSDLICNENKPMDFINNPFDMYIAYAIRFKAAEMVYRKIQNSSNINRYTMMDGEQISKNIMLYGKAYQQNIAYLAENINVSDNDCFTCKNNTNIIKTGILS